jgi:alcohol dehydrogenase class IV
MMVEKSWGFGPVPRVESGPINHDLLKTYTKNKNVLLVTSKSLKNNRLLNSLVDNCGANEIRVTTVTPNPTWAAIDSHITNLKKWQPAVILAIGGGSVLDTAKVISVALETSATDISKNKSELANVKRTIKLIMIPTTAGTGSEMTPFATVWTAADSGKESIETHELIPDLVFLDANFLVGVPNETILYPALDAVSHAVETLWNKYQTPFSRECAKQSLEKSIDIVPKFLEGILPYEELQEMLHASSLAGMAIAESHTALAHSISYPISSKFGVPHGLACSFTIPAICDQFTNNEWDKVHHSHIVQKASNMLRTLNLTPLINKYLSSKECLELLPLMNTKSRADNFIVATQDIDLNDIVERSF